MLKEPEIKLFGRKIYVPENGTAVACGERAGEWSNESSGGSSDCDRCLEQSRGQDGKEVGSKEQQEQSDEELAEGEICESSAENEESQSTGAPSESDENPKTPPPDDDVKLENEDNGAATNPEQKTLKKPDKIIPCPRCNSMDTKFCYYNNYNVNQPRHFCKSCQRYWTAGGTMRNVPVGAGRRKNKNCRHITISEALHANGFHNLKFKPNGTVLSFGPDSNQIAEKRAPNGYCSKRNDCATSPSIAMPNPAVDGFQHRASMHGMNGFPCVPWPFPWNTPVLPPMPYYLWNSGGWDAASPNSPLGKHSRSGEVVDLQGEKRRGSIVVPKTLRMDDPKEAARSSIWSTLGIKYDSISREGLFKALQPNGSDKKPAMEAVASPLMQANPAALSRSLAFQERT